VLKNVKQKHGVTMIPKNAKLVMQLVKLVPKEVLTTV